jgi:hypothetical protein
MGKIKAEMRAGRAEPEHIEFGHILPPTLIEVDTWPDAHAVRAVLDSVMLEVVQYQQSKLDERVGQFSLGVVGDFSPSKNLTDIWISSLLALGKAAGRETVATADFEIAQEFSKTLTTLLGTRGHQLRYQRNVDLAITSQRQFTPDYQIQICDAFLIIPMEAPDFLKELQVELSDAIASGCSVEGAWGKIRLNSSGDLVYDLNEQGFVADPDFEESEEIE